MPERPQVHPIVIGEVDDGAVHTAVKDDVAPLLYIPLCDTPVFRHGFVETPPELATTLREVPTSPFAPIMIRSDGVVVDTVRVYELPGMY